MLNLTPGMHPIERFSFSAAKKMKVVSVSPIQDVKTSQSSTLAMYASHHSLQSLWNKGTEVIHDKFPPTSNANFHKNTEFTETLSGIGQNQIHLLLFSPPHCSNSESSHLSYISQLRRSHPISPLCLQLHLLNLEIAKTYCKSTL